MENQPFFSIVMPVYNVECYLEEAVSSVLKQTFNDYELILIDDCSKDSSGQLCDEFCEQYKRVKVIHKEKNEGLAYARNTGIDAAHGKWIIFMDSDDWIEVNLLEDLYKEIEKKSFDIVVWGYCQEFMNENGKVTDRVINLPGTKECVGKTQIAKACIELDEKKSFAYAWNKVYKKEFLDKNHFYFENIQLMEDFFFNIKVFQCAKNIVIVNKVYSHYRKPAHETLVSKYSPEFFELCKKRYNAQYEMVKKCDIYTADIQEKMLTIHIKHLLSACIKEVSKKGNLNLKQQYASIKQIINDKHTCKILKENIVLTNTKLNVIKNLYRTRWTLGVLILVKIAYVFQNKCSKVWKKLIRMKE